MTFRKTLFWIHLFAGLLAGLSIAIMCFTGTVLAFEKELVAWSERDARQITPPAPGATRLPLAELQAKFRAAQPDARPQSLVFQNDPLAAVAFSVGRSGTFYAHPYTGEIRQPASPALGEFMHTMTDLHRVLGFHGETSRPRGKLINGICNLAFFVLAVTGLYLWMPRTWSWRAVKPVLWFRSHRTSKGRDFNWHNAIGLWTAPVLIVLTITALPISFQWGGQLIFTLTGTPAPAPGNGSPGGGPGGGPVISIPAPAPDTKPLPTDALLAAVQQQVPAWKTLTLRTGNAGGGGRGGNASASAPPPTPPAALLPAVTFTLRESTSWPRTANTTLSVNPYTGAIVQRTGYTEQNAAQQVRSWTRFLHTGEALGPIGQLIAGLACLGGVFLVYTGFALSYRRFFGRSNPSDPAASA